MQRTNREFSYHPWTTRQSVLLLGLIVPTLILLGVGKNARAGVDDRIDGAYSTSSLGLAVTMSAQHREGVLPPVSSEGAVLMPEPGVGHRGYLVDGRVTGLTVDEDAALLLSYLDGYRAFTMHDVYDTPGFVYLGHAVSNDEEGRALLAAYRERLARGESLDGDITVADGTGTAGSDTLYQLRTDLSDDLADRGIKTDETFDAGVPLFIEFPGQHDVPGGWVISLNRKSVKYLPYPGPFPMTEEFIGGLEALRRDFSREPDAE